LTVDASRVISRKGSLLPASQTAYGALTFLYLDANTGPALTALIYQNGEQDTYVDGSCDVIVGPIMGDVRRMQQKFESTAAEALLNGNSTTRTVLP
jgi:hypothetical protein